MCLFSRNNFKIDFNLIYLSYLNVCKCIAHLIQHFSIKQILVNEFLETIKELLNLNESVSHILKTIKLLQKIGKSFEKVI